jgi:hypothetical protein
MEFPKPFVEILREARAQHPARDANPLRDKLEGIVRGMQAVSTHALLDLLSLPQTAENRRRIAATMRSIGGFVPIKSRRLEPGGWSDTVTRGWARPLRGAGTSRPKKPSGPDPQTAGGRNANQ